ncbi:MAG: hypothetical protein LBP79_04550 [Clostridiales bacterium]|jgi:hypothetical protein|nr:hypothetical protein [Clostridiales bacterium]
MKLAEFRLTETGRVLTGDVLDKFDGDLFRNLIECATLADNEIRFYLYRGLSLPNSLTHRPK